MKPGADLFDSDSRLWGWRKQLVRREMRFQCRLNQLRQNQIDRARPREARQAVLIPGFYGLGANGHAHPEQETTLLVKMPILWTCRGRGAQRNFLKPVMRLFLESSGAAVPSRGLEISQRLFAQLYGLPQFQS